MVSVRQPANAQIWTSTLASILNTELISPEMTTEKAWNTEPDYEYIQQITINNEVSSLTPQLQETGFETFNPLLNLGGQLWIIIITMGEMGLVVACTSLWRFLKRCRSVIQNEGGSEIERSRLSRWLSAHTRKLFFTQLLVIVYESVVQLSLSALLFYYLPQGAYETSVEAYAVYIS